MNLDPSTLLVREVRSHDSQLTCCRYWPDGKGVVAAGHEGRLYVFSAESSPAAGEGAGNGKQPPVEKAVVVQTIPGHSGWVESLQWTADQQRLISADSWGRVCAWRRRERQLEVEPIWTIESAGASWLRDMALDDSGSRLATCGNDGVVRVYAVSDGRLARELRGHTQPVLSVAFSPSGKELVSGDLHGRIAHWDMETGERRREFKAEPLFKQYYQYRQGGVRRLAFSPSGSFLYAAGFQGTNANQAQGNPRVFAFDWETGELAREHAPSDAFLGPVMDVVVLPSGVVAASGSSEGGGALWFWRPDEAKSFATIKHSTSLRRFDMHPNGTRFVAAAFGNLDGQRGGNGRRLTNEGEYPDFGGQWVVFA